MSIIADALRKAEGGSPPGPATPRPTWLYRLLLVGCVAVLAVGLTRLLRTNPRPATQPLLPATSQRTAAPMPLPRAAEPKPEVGKIRGPWALRGIVRGGGGKPVALINDRIVEEGDPIGARRLVRIEADSVLLQDETGQLKILRMNQE